MQPYVSSVGTLIYDFVTFYLSEHRVPTIHIIQDRYGMYIHSLYVFDLETHIV